MWNNDKLVWDHSCSSVTICKYADSRVQNTLPALRFLLGRISLANRVLKTLRYVIQIQASCGERVKSIYTGAFHKRMWNKSISGDVCSQPTMITRRSSANRSLAQCLNCLKNTVQNGPILRSMLGFKSGEDLYCSCPSRIYWYIRTANILGLKKADGAYIIEEWTAIQLKDL